MPELPEVETTRRGIEPHVVGRKVTLVTVRDRRLRWPFPVIWNSDYRAQSACDPRRAKYLLIDFQDGSLLVHLGMSGSLRLVTENEEPRKHDHVDIGLDSGFLLRYHDPRRFGSMHWLDDASHMLLDHLGPEPLSTDFSADYLYRTSRKRSAPIKHFIMDAKVVVGVGNIYANEALFMAGIRPDRAPIKSVKRATSYW